MSKRFTWGKPVVQPRVASGMFNLHGRSESPKPTDNSVPDIKKLRMDVKELNDAKNKKGVKK